MVNNSYRNHEALYLVISNDKNVRNQINEWSKQYSRSGLEFQNNQLMIYNQNSLHLFYLNWKGDGKSISIWDCWNKRHLENIL